MAKSSAKILNDIYKKLYASFGPQDWWPGHTRFEVIVGAILTQNTNWQNVEKALHNLKKAKVLSANAIKDLPLSKLAQYIKPSGYFNVKAKRLKNFVTFLFRQYDGSINQMAKQEGEVLRKELLAVNGIGKETADSILLYAFKHPIFVIDAYTKRFLTRHNIVDHNISYDHLQGFFTTNLKRDLQLFNEYHALIVRLGKDYCKPKARCVQCPLNYLNQTTQYAYFS